MVGPSRWASLQGLEGGGPRGTRHEVALSPRGRGRPGKLSAAQAGPRGHTRHSVRVSSLLPACTDRHARARPGDSGCLGSRVLQGASPPRGVARGAQCHHISGTNEGRGHFYPEALPWPMSQGRVRVPSLPASRPLWLRTSASPWGHAGGTFTRASRSDCASIL